MYGNVHPSNMKSYYHLNFTKSHVIITKKLESTQSCEQIVIRGALSSWNIFAIPKALSPGQIMAITPSVS